MGSGGDAASAAGHSPFNRRGCPLASRMPTSLLAIGGARSGKSRHASAWLRTRPGPYTYLATARHDAEDPEMMARIARHRADRANQDWLLVEEPLAVAHVIRMAVLGPVLVDCATLWLTNLGMTCEWDEPTILQVVDNLCALPADPPVDVAVVTNEVGQGVVPATPLGRQFQDLQGHVNQRLAAACRHVDLLVAGLPLTLKPRP